ncbi:hypothetical protein F2P81_004218 [Scophthalmus maximus]|uniref:Uncharacterized protein n=1 Tax=Scophthalmus maximus TaxID=52904 RepID=A0A6A4TJ39_SCOMX|nr:hypothetical protein F2P81_004218 [Scophthalmus maximus]
MTVTLLTAAELSSCSASGTIRRRRHRMSRKCSCWSSNASDSCCVRHVSKANSGKNARTRFPLKSSRMLETRE